MRIFGGSVKQAARAALAGPPVQQSIVSPWQPQPNQLGAVTLTELYEAKSLAGLPLTRTEAMTVPAFARCRHVLSGTVGRLPLEVMRGAAPAPIDYPHALSQPERGRPRFTTLSWTADAMLCFGRAWWVVTERYATDNRPAAFEWVPEWSAQLSMTGELIGHQDGRTFATADVVRIDAPHEGVLTFASRTLRAAVALDRAAGRTANNPVPSIDLHQLPGTPPLTDPEIDATIARWVRSRSGENGAVGFSSSSIEVRALGQSPEQLLIEGRKTAALEVARVCGMPAWVVDVGVEGSSLTYSNVASRSRELIDYGVAPYLEAIAGRLSMDDILPRGVWCRFDTNQLLRDDFAARMAAYKVAVESGVYTIEELRAMERGRPMEDDSL